MLRKAAVYQILLLFSIAGVLLGNVPYQVVMLQENSTAYVLVNNVAKPLPDPESVETLGFQLENLQKITLPELEKYKLGSPAPSLKYTDKSSDDLTRVEVIKSLVLNGPLLHSYEAVGEYINPCITKWQGRLLLATGLSWGQAGANHKAATNTMEFRWVNNSDYPFHTTDPYLGIYNEIEEPPTMIIGQDPRIVVLNDPDRFQVYFTNQFEAIARMGMAEIAVNRTTGTVQVAKSCFTINPTHESHKPQKNWSPFLYGNEVLLIQSINPFVVVKVATQEDGKMTAFKESAQEALPIKWPYGELRGGTNAVYLPEKKIYFAFFHSAGHVPGNWLKTYFIGAYTFSPTPPFRLLSMSPAPIMPGEFYSGAWYPIKKRTIDYCVFPLSIFIEGETIVMGAGHQDQIGYIMKFGLQEVLDTLVPVQ